MKPYNDRNVADSEEEVERDAAKAYEPPKKKKKPLMSEDAAQVLATSNQEE